MIQQAPSAPLLALLARVAQRGAAPTNTSGGSSSLAAAFASSRLAFAPLGSGSGAPSAPDAAKVTSAAEPTSPAEASAPSPTAAPSAAAAAAEARAALRAVLRAVDVHFTSVAGNRQWRDYVLEQARKLREGDERARGGSSADAADAAAAAQAAAIVAAAEAARDYASLVSTVARHRALLREYNIGLDPDERNRQMVEKTAARVGFSIPQAKAVEEEDDEEQGQGAGDGGAPSIARRAAMARAAATAATFGSGGSGSSSGGGSGVGGGRRGAGGKEA